MNLFNGDCLEKLKLLDDNSIDSVVTDPPYGLAFMGKKWDYDVPSVEIWKEVLRVLKPGGHLLSFGGTRTYHRMVINIEDAGFEIRDQIMWLYGSGFPKSMDISKAIDKQAGATREVVGKKTRPNGKEYGETTGFGNLGLNGTRESDLESGAEKTVTGRNISSEIERLKRIKESSAHENLTAPATDSAKQWQGWGTALKPANEPICLARKPISEKTVASNVLKHGTGALNIDESRVGAEMIESGRAGRSVTDSIYKDGLAPQIEKQFSQGRWPANVILDEIAGEVLDGQTGIIKSGKPGIKNKGNEGAAYGAESRPPGTQMSGFGDSGGASRFFYCAKTSKAERNAGLEGMPEKIKKGAMTDSNWSGEERFDGKPLSRQQNTHPTVKPIKLMSYLVKLITPPGGIVLDPFMGSGSTGVAAKKDGFKFVGIERDEQYFEIASKRVEGAA